MTDSERLLGDSMVIGNQGTLLGCADLPVPPDAGRERQQPLCDPRHNPGRTPAALFERELSLEGVDVFERRPSPPRSRALENPHLHGLPPILKTRGRADQPADLLTQAIPPRFPRRSHAAPTGFQRSCLNSIRSARDSENASLVDPRGFEPLTF